MLETYLLIISVRINKTQAYLLKEKKNKKQTNKRIIKSNSVKKIPLSYLTYNS